MSDAVDQGITVTEMSAMDQPIDLSTETTTAFVGRTLRGPLNTPVRVTGLSEFRRRFGGRWRRSGLDPAVARFFEHGGKQLHVVRVANAARGAMLCLPADGNALVLRAAEPGSTERLRAAVDYDRVEDADSFNLTLQRIDPDSGRIIDQELHPGLSVDAEADRFVATALATSSLARAEQPYPHHRPEATGSGYVEAVQRGTDGAELSDYDIVGSRRDGTGIFALNGVEHIDLLYLAPSGADDVGPTAVFAAELYCRGRGAMLIVDPRRDWESASDAVSGMRRLGYASPNLLGYFPRPCDRQSKAIEAAGGAIAGLLARLDREVGSWQSLEDAGLSFSRQLMPSLALGPGEQELLIRAGLNPLVCAHSGRPVLNGDRTMGRGNETQGLYSCLSIRRTCLRILSLVDHSTRWAVFERVDEWLIAHIQGQMSAFFACLADLEVFADDQYSVDCAALPPKPDGPTPGVSIDLRFRPRGASNSVSLTLQQSLDGLRVVGTAFARTR